MNVLKSDVSEYFSQKKFVKGSGIYRRGEVLSLHVQPHSKNNSIVFVDGEVMGSYQPSYKTNATIEFEGEKLKNISGDCQCPSGYNCKHVVALSLKFVLESDCDSRGTNQIDNWLDTIIPNAIEEKKEVGSFIAYRLFKHNPRSKQPLRIVRSHYADNGSVVFDHEMSHSSLLYGSSYGVTMDDADKYIVSMYEKATRYGSGNAIFEGISGYYLIEQIVKTGRAYLGDEKVSPLHFVEKKRELRFYFGTNESSDSLTTVSLENDILAHEILVPTQPVIIINPDYFSVEFCDSKIESSLLDKLTTLPHITENDIPKLYFALRERIPFITLQRPESVINNYTLQECEALPTLIITRDYLSKIPSFKGRLHFNYGDKEVGLPIVESSVVFENNQPFEIVRNSEKEHAFCQQLLEVGMSYQVETDRFSFEVEKGADAMSIMVKWDDFLNGVAKTLEDDGWNISFDNETLDFIVDYEVTVESENGNSWFDLSFFIEISGKKCKLAPLIVSLLNHYDSVESLPPVIYLEYGVNEFIKVKKSEVTSIFKVIEDLLGSERDGDFKVQPMDAHLLGDIDRLVIWKGSREVLELAEKLNSFDKIEQYEPSEKLQATLRPYQQEGLNWLNFLREFKFNGILADDMGLGKTLQTLAFIQRMKEDGVCKKPILIVVPTSLLSNWFNELDKFTPNLSCFVLYGPNRHEHFKNIANYDVVITTYNLVQRDEAQLIKRDFFYIILDEAQKIKNPKSKVSQTLKNLKSEYRLSLSGTPIENHLGELWSQFSFLMPGFLQSKEEFKSTFRKPIEEENSASKQKLLNRKIRPFMLRRTKEEVVTELPEKVEIIKYAGFGAKQVKLYETIRVTMEEHVRDMIEMKGFAKSQITILDALLKLRQVCCDPAIVKLDSAKKVKESAKRDLFIELVSELAAEGRKIIVFSQFTSMLSILEDEVKKLKLKYTKLTGSTRKRDEVIEKFTKGDAQVFLISLKAGGVGLNLTQADTVIHYDLWWNPAVENQATDRAYRIGQDKRVFVYKLVAENSIEEKILKLQEKKKLLQESVYRDGKMDNCSKLSQEDLMELLDMVKG